MSRGGPWLTREERKVLTGVAGVGIALVLLVAGLLWVLGAEQRAIQTMEPGRRAVVFQRSFASFESLCREDPGGSLSADCRRQARFLQKFPECVDVCREEVSRYLFSASR